MRAGFSSDNMYKNSIYYSDPEILDLIAMVSCIPSYISIDSEDLKLLFNNSGVSLFRVAGPSTLAITDAKTKIDIMLRERGIDPSEGYCGLFIIRPSKNAPLDREAIDEFYKLIKAGNNETSEQLFWIAEADSDNLELILLLKDEPSYHNRSITFAEFDEYLDLKCPK